MIKLRTKSDNIEMPSYADLSLSNEEPLPSDFIMPMWSELYIDELKSETIEYPNRKIRYYLTLTESLSSRSVCLSAWDKVVFKHIRNFFKKAFRGSWEMVIDIEELNDFLIRISELEPELKAKKLNILTERLHPTGKPEHVAKHDITSSRIWNL